jgi:hypothetical protein
MSVPRPRDLADSKPDRHASGCSRHQGQAPSRGRFARTLHDCPLADHAVFFSLREQDAKWAVGIEEVTGFDNSNRHGLAILCGDFPQPGGRIECAGMSFLDRKPGFRSDTQDVDDGPEFGRAIMFPEPARQPKAFITTADLWPSFVNRTAARFALVFA